ncbi:cell surface glycoprotein 1-like isoform X1 [Rhineura floridana]|uniref:cell surface glycoprotein 1-like isoform X1 n=1 Tax=Rhineura floridana TaxID=261503 RepID=UPI002AC812AC|nr:cell surface glycoprotein 1-like isoform X1 [Rhineura floridana]
MADFGSSGEDHVTSNSMDLPSKAPEAKPGEDEISENKTFSLPLISNNPITNTTNSIVDTDTESYTSDDSFQRFSYPLQGNIVPQCASRYLTTEAHARLMRESREEEEEEEENPREGEFVLQTTLSDYRLLAEEEGNVPQKGPGKEPKYPYDIFLATPGEMTCPLKPSKQEEGGEATAAHQPEEKGSEPPTPPEKTVTEAIIPPMSPIERVWVTPPTPPEESEESTPPTPPEERELATPPTPPEKVRGTPPMSPIERVWVTPPTPPEESEESTPPTPPEEREPATPPTPPEKVRGTPPMSPIERVWVTPPTPPEESEESTPPTPPEEREPATPPTPPEKVRGTPPMSPIERVWVTPPTPPEESEESTPPTPPEEREPATPPTPPEKVRGTPPMSPIERVWVTPPTPPEESEESTPPTPPEEREPATPPTPPEKVRGTPPMSPIERVWVTPPTPPEESEESTPPTPPEEREPATPPTPPEKVRGIPPMSPIERVWVTPPTPPEESEESTPPTPPEEREPATPLTPPEKVRGTPPMSPIERVWVTPPTPPEESEESTPPTPPEEREPATPPTPPEKVRGTPPMSPIERVWVTPPTPPEESEESTPPTPPEEREPVTPLTPPEKVRGTPPTPPAEWVWVTPLTPLEGVWGSPPPLTKRGSHVALPSTQKVLPIIQLPTGTEPAIPKLPAPGELAVTPHWPPSAGPRPQPEKEPVVHWPTAAKELPVLLPIEKSAAATEGMSPMKSRLPTSLQSEREVVIRTETKAWPMTEDPTSSILINLKPKALAVAHRGKDKSFHDALEDIASQLKEASSTSRSAMANSISSFVESPVGKVFANTIDRALEKSEEWLNYYLPLPETSVADSSVREEERDPSPDDLCKEGCFMRIDSLSTQLRNRAFKFVLHQLKMTRRNTHEHLSVLDQVLDLLDHCHSLNPSNFPSVSGKLSSMWSEWNTKPETTSRRPSAKALNESLSLLPEQLEMKALGLTRVLTQELYGTYHNLLPHVSELPAHLQEKVSQVYENMEDLQSHLSSTTSLRELPSSLLVQSRQKIASARENLDELLDFMVQSQPAQWLSQPSSSRAGNLPPSAAGNKPPKGGSVESKEGSTSPQPPRP